MKLYLISQTENDNWDTYGKAVVCAIDETQARNMNPGTGKPMIKKDWNNREHMWCSSPKQVVVEYLGETQKEREPGVILCASNTSITRSELLGM